jgi:outer membrane protein assembly factor BamB
MLATADNWPQFRGPNGDGVAATADPPIQWSETRNIAWKVRLPGRGRSSPVVLGNRIWLTTAYETPADEDEARQRLQGHPQPGDLDLATRVILAVVCLDRASGKQLYEVRLFDVDKPDPVHKLNSYATPTPVAEPGRVFCDFGTFGTACLEAETGKILWKSRLPVEHLVGPGSSPVLYKDLLLLVRDGCDVQYVAALDKRTGQRLWKTDRPPIQGIGQTERKSFSTPLLIEAAGRVQMIALETQWVVSYDPATGKEIWRVKHGSGFSVAPRPVFAHGMVFICTGCNVAELWAIRVDGQGDVTDTHVAWKAKGQIPIMSSPLCVGDEVYCTSDSGIASCFDAQTGRLHWRERLGGKYLASPVCAAGRLYFFNMDGKTTVLRAGKQFVRLAENPLEGPLAATPAALDHALFLRTDSHLWCVSSAATIELKNSQGLRWQLEKRGGRWTLGTLFVHDKPVDAPLASGIVALSNIASRQVSWPAATEAKQLDERSARFAGSEKIGDVRFRFEVDVALKEDVPAATLAPRWSVDKDLNGFEVCLAYQGVGAGDWRVQSYPFAGNSETAAIAPMRYCGVPGALVYRPDLSLVVLFTIDVRFDYLNPTTWTGKTGFHFVNRRTAPQFRCGGGKLSAGVRYEHPLQLFLSDAGEFAGAIGSIVESWIKVNNYKVDESLFVRTPREAFQITLEGRRKMASWKPGIGYEHHRGTPFVYVGNNPYIACYEYRLFEMTGDPEWRKRAFEQIDFALQGQQADPSKPDYGVMHTSWYFRRQGEAEGFCSWDWGHNGYKVDLNVWMARYILQTWQRVKRHEGLDRRDWHKAALAAADWAVARQNADGGLPQVVEIATGKKSSSAVCGRALVGLPIIAEITGDKRYLKVSEEMEKFLRANVESRFWYTGMHPDLPPNDFEQDSIYAVVEYWLDKHDRTGRQECLDRAVANAYYALLYWCPKQLSWVKNPTQCAHSEQQHFNQYSVYCYGNRKIECLARLAQKTGNPLFKAFERRVVQMNFYTQVTDGPFRGSLTEAICDPWLERQGGFEWRGSPYTSELVTDLMLQLMDLGLVKTAPSHAVCSCWGSRRRR